MPLITGGKVRLFEATALKWIFSRTEDGPRKEPRMANDLFTPFKVAGAMLQGGAKTMAAATTGNPLEVISEAGKGGMRVLDSMTGGDRVDIDTTTTVPGNDPAQWADTFQNNPANISPLATGARNETTGKSGRPFPGGPRIQIDVEGRQDTQLPDGRKQTILDVRYQQSFQGKGRITVTEEKGGGLSVRDQWKDVKNNSHLSSRAAEAGHPKVAAMGFANIGRESLKKK